MYDTPDELLREIRAGEDSHLEFKEVVFKGDQVRFARETDRTPIALAKTLTCFANTDGGVVVLGVTKTGDLVGVAPDRVDLLQRFVATAAARDSCEPPLDHLLLIDNILLPGPGGDEVLVVKVEVKAARFAVHAPKGRRPYRRVGTACPEMTMEQQARLLERRGQLHPFEERPAFTAPVDCLDERLFAAYYEQRFGEPLAASTIPYERLLRNFRLVAEDEVGTPHPTVLGLLLFCQEPQYHVGGAFVDIVVYDATVADANHQRDARMITGTVPSQIEQCVRYLSTSPYLPIAAEKDGFGRRDLPAYSLRALQEGIVNALVHRDYQLVGSQTRLFVFPDRIEISSPGALHNTLRPEDVFAGCNPYRRNQLLAGFLRDYASPVTGRAYMESRGEGFLMMVRESLTVSGGFQTS